MTVPLTSCMTGLDQSVLQIKTKIVSCHAADSKPVKQEVNGTVILPPLVFPARSNLSSHSSKKYLIPTELCEKLDDECMCPVAKVLKHFTDVSYDFS